MKRTKIICTMGPASSKKNTLRAMMRAGMDIARFNFSHGSHEEHRGRVDMVKNLREELNIPVALQRDRRSVPSFLRIIRRLHWRLEANLHLLPVI